MSDRFLIRSLEVDDASSEYLSWLQDPLSVKFIESSSKEWSIPKLSEFISLMIARPDVIFFGIFERESHRHIGNIKFEKIDKVAGSAELGVLIGPNWRNQGVFGEIFRVLQKVFADSLGIAKIYLGVSAENIYAIRSYKKCGFCESKHGYFSKGKRRFSGIEMVAVYSPSKS